MIVRYSRQGRRKGTPAVEPAAWESKGLLSSTGGEGEDSADWDCTFLDERAVLEGAIGCAAALSAIIASQFNEFLLVLFKAIDSGWEIFV
jgi:hypothetical protein